MCEPRLGCQNLTFPFRSEEEASSIIMFGILFGITAGIMTEVAIKSLLLEAARYDPEDRVVSKVCTGYFRKFLVLVKIPHVQSNWSIV